MIVKTATPSSLSMMSAQVVCLTPCQSWSMITIWARCSTCVIFHRLRRACHRWRSGQMRRKSVMSLPFAQRAKHSLMRSVPVSAVRMRYWERRLKCESLESMMNCSMISPWICRCKYCLVVHQRCSAASRCKPMSWRH